MLINSPVRHIKTVEFGLFFYNFDFVKKIVDIYECLRIFANICEKFFYSTILYFFIE